MLEWAANAFYFRHFFKQVIVYVYNEIVKCSVKKLVAILMIQFTNLLTHLLTNTLLACLFVKKPAVPNIDIMAGLWTIRNKALGFEV